MDQSVTITPHAISFPPANDGEVYTQTFMYRPPQADILSRRGEIFALLSIQPVPAELDAPALTKHIFDYLQEHLFGNTAGGVLEALESCAHHALEFGGQLLQQTKATNHQPYYFVDLQMSAVAVWGKAFYYYRTPQIYLGQMQGGELIDLDQHQVGSDALRDGDLIILATPTFARRIFKPFLQEQENTFDVAEHLPQLREKAINLEGSSSAGAVLLSVNVAEVPSEEDVIEIEVAEERKHSGSRLLSKLPQFSGFKVPNPSRLAQIFNRRKKVEKPEVYLRPRIPQGKKGRLMLAFFLAVLLIVSSVVTYKYNQQQQRENTAREKLQQTQEKIIQAKELATLNPKQAQQLISEAEQDLGAVLGVSEKFSHEAQQIRQEVELVTENIYQTNIIEAQPVQLPEQLDEKSFLIDVERGVINRKNALALKREDAWQTPVAAEDYFDNFYVLDHGANQIHKYIGTPGGYSNRRDYFTRSINLTNALDLAIDGNVYVLFSDGRIEKYTAGERDEFRLNEFHPPLQNPQVLETNPSARHLYLVQSNAILVFNKDGQYQHQFRVENVSSINDLILADDESRLWLHSLDGWHEIVL